MRAMGTVFMLVMLFACAGQEAFAARTLYLANGETVTGDIVEENDSFVRISFYGALLTYYREDIDHIGEDIKKTIPARLSPPQPAVTAGGNQENKTYSRREKKSFFWKVTGGSNTVYLLGSIHLARRSLYPLPSRIEAAFASADVLAVEVNIDKGNEAYYQQTLAEAGAYPRNDSIRNYISPKNYQALKKKLAYFSLPALPFERYKPWYLALILTKIELDFMGYKAEYGIDTHFLAKAKGKKAIEELESWDYQIGIFENLTASEQDIFLDYILKYLNAVEDDMNKIIALWKNGDTEGMQRLLFDKWLREDPRLLPVYKKIFYERNARMGRKIEVFLSRDRDYFVVVGAGHLIGKTGIVHQLKEKGYSIVQM